jgi:hypothetical protein
MNDMKIKNEYKNVDILAYNEYIKNSSKWFTRVFLFYSSKE